MNLMPLLQQPETLLKPAAHSQHPRTAYYDREPSKILSAIGVSIRTGGVRSTDWHRRPPARSRD
jgi:iduronate 2-sulfatase